MSDIDRNFVLNALFWLAVGTLFGFWMGASNNIQYVGVHVTFVLVGFVTLFIYGAIYRLWPELKGHKLARFQFWLAVVAVPFMALGSWLQIQSGQVAVIAVSSAVSIASVLMLCWIYWSGTKAA